MRQHGTLKDDANPNHVPLTWIHQKSNENEDPERVCCARTHLEVISIYHLEVPWKK